MGKVYPFAILMDMQMGVGFDCSGFGMNAEKGMSWMNPPSMQADHRPEAQGTAFSRCYMDPCRAFFERLAEEWDALQPPDREERLRQLLMHYWEGLKDARNILEIGTGTGALIPLLRELAPAAHLVSVDLAYAMLRRARGRCPDARLVQADAHRLPFLAGAFDWVICHNVFPHFRDKRAALAELAYVLRPRGFLLVLHDRGREEVNAIHQGAGGPIGNDLLPPGEELAHLFEEIGFVPIEVEDVPERYRIIGYRSDQRG